MIEELFNELPWYKKIEVLRAEKGWGQREAGKRCLTNCKNYWLWEKGKSYPRLASRKAIADAYGVKIKDIFSTSDQILSQYKVVSRWQRT